MEVQLAVGQISPFPSKAALSCALWCSVLGSFSPFLNPKQLRNGTKPHIFSSSLLNKQKPQKLKSCCPTPSPPPNPNTCEYCCWTQIFLKIKTWECAVMRSKSFRKNLRNLRGKMHWAKFLVSWMYFCSPCRGWAAVAESARLLGYAGSESLIL